MITIKLILLLFIFSELVGAILGAWKLWQFRHTGMLVKGIGVALVGIAVEILFSLIANAGNPTGLHRSAWFLWWYYSGRVIRSSALWGLVIYLMGIQRENNLK